MAVKKPTAAKKPAAPKAAAAPKPAAPKAKPAAAPKAETVKAKPAEKAKAAISEKLIEPIKAAGEAMKSSGQKAAMNSAAVSMKIIDHAEANTREAFAAIRAAAGSASLTDILKVQGDYIREQGGRSMTQAREIGELIAQFGRDAITPLKGKKD